MGDVRTEVIRGVVVVRTVDQKVKILTYDENSGY